MWLLFKSRLNGNKARHLKVPDTIVSGNGENKGEAESALLTLDSEAMRFALVSGTLVKVVTDLGLALHFLLCLLLLLHHHYKRCLGLLAAWWDRSWVIPDGAILDQPVASVLKTGEVRPEHLLSRPWPWAWGARYGSVSHRGLRLCNSIIMAVNNWQGRLWL